MRIIHKHQQIPENLNLLLIKESAFPVKKDRYSLLLQQIRQLWSVCTYFRHQDHHIFICIFIPRDQFPDQFRRMIRDRFQAGLFPAHVQQIHHHGFIPFAVCPARPQFIQRGVYQICSFFPHDITENRVGCFQYFRTGTEVFLQENTLPRIRFLIRNS